ncbi:hypothetical protein EUX98_g4767 [Antrodiella citrinella]|uniref:NADP-dependent oxidoreductase domain-containing protein n=1 Tax=Antrodiella citrinella TaxID=2447956 RepID=A0A4S4MTE6_9APHY|nr:hypothetical protein EUX98_g4767 [Antrodiella citrinella]
MELTLESKMKLRDGNEIPLFGFGTYELEGSSVTKPLTWALEAGYRHIVRASCIQTRRFLKKSDIVQDSAAWYSNEKECGAAIRAFLQKTGLPRSDIFFTTKLRHNSTYDSVKSAIDKSVKDCGLEYIDLYLLHSAIGGPDARKESWRAVCDAKNEVRGERFKHPALTKLAKKYKKDPAQVLLRYSLQKGYIPIPKSASQKRIESNTNVFDFALADEEIARLDALNEMTDWEVTTCQ